MFLTLEIKFKNGISVETTLNHLFYLKDTGYVEAWKLEKNNKIFSINKYEEIEEIYEKEYFVKDIYNFSVERNNNYYISELDLLVHNKGESCADQLKKLDNVNIYDVDVDLATSKMDEFRKGITENKYNELMDECFTEGTEVFSKDNLKINEIEKGDFVYSYNFEKEKIEEKEVLTIFKSRVDRIIKLTLKNIETNLIEDIETTLEHLFYTNGNYKLAKYLKIGDELKSFNNETVEITNVETKKLEKEIFVYNIEVKDNHNYFVGGNKILVHNKKTRYKYDDKTGKYETIDVDGNKVYQDSIPDRLSKGKPKQARNVETHLKNGGEIAINENGKWSMGLPKVGEGKLSDKYASLRDGYYVVDYPDGMGSFKNHSMDRFDCDRNQLIGDTYKDFDVFDKKIAELYPEKFPKSEDVKSFRSIYELTLHHEGNGFEVVDSTLHSYFKHTGEAAVLRYEVDVKEITGIRPIISDSEYWYLKNNGIKPRDYKIN